MVVLHMVMELGVARKFRIATPACKGFLTFLLNADLFDSTCFFGLSFCKTAIYCEEDFFVLLCNPGFFCLCILDACLFGLLLFFGTLLD